MAMLDVELDIHTHIAGVTAGRTFLADCTTPEVALMKARTLLHSKFPAVKIDDFVVTGRTHPNAGRPDGTHHVIIGIGRDGRPLCTLTIRDHYTKRSKKKRIAHPEAVAIPPRRQSLHLHIVCDYAIA